MSKYNLSVIQELKIDDEISHVIHKIKDVVAEELDSDEEGTSIRLHLEDMINYCVKIIKDDNRAPTS